MDPLLPAERQRRILDIVNDKGVIRINELSDTLRVSKMTIRRDLDALAQQGHLNRTHGGAVVRQHRLLSNYVYKDGAAVNRGAKNRIARQAASMILADEVVFISAGTTTAKIAAHVDAVVSATIFTHNLGLLENTSETTAEIILLGGTFNPRTHSVYGARAIDTVQQVYAHRMFIAPDGLSASMGLTSKCCYCAEVNRAMMDHTKGTVVALADHTKFGRVASYRVADLDRIDVLITDEPLPEDLAEAARSQGIHHMVI